MVAFGVPVKMRNCCDEDYLLLSHVEKSIWKALQHASPRFFANFRPCLWHEKNSFYSSGYLLIETIAQTRQLMVVILNGLLQFDGSWS